MAHDLMEQKLMYLNYIIPVFMLNKNVFVYSMYTYDYNLYKLMCKFIHYIYTYS